jgi:glycosyltransferase involved in cell wall biosynthesis
MVSSSNLTVIAVIPAYNEARTVQAVVRAVLTQVSAVIVVDDHSSDATSDQARAGGAIVVRHQTNLGYDASINDGFKEAAERGAQVFLTIDADGEHDVSDIPRMLGPILSGAADIVAGQRPVTRHVAENVFALYTRLRFGIKDPMCGFKVYRRDVYNTIGYFDSVKSIGTELMLRGCARGFRLVSLPITLHGRKGGDASRFYHHALRGNFRVLQAMLRVLFIKA